MNGNGCRLTREKFQGRLETREEGKGLKKMCSQKIKELTTQQKAPDARRANPEE
jgi:hypothetical protein